LLFITALPVTGYDDITVSKIALLFEAIFREPVKVGNAAILTMANKCLFAGGWKICRG